ncbi:DUF6390 family protein [Nocardia sp. CA-119907]|uniref:DUF6390 family protein n=1 Tax=Nocardia sp. CA-119907 TaxID=3239973 RepID=UPI003D97AC07
MESTRVDGTDMFARYANAPNALGFCGPADAELRGGARQAVRAAAQKFSGAWPYLQVMSKLTGIDDPLDGRLVESYWLGGGVGADLDAAEFAAELLAVIGPVAGHYWAHLTPDLAGEAAANHCFHVFGVYPWSRLLGKGNDEHPVCVLDSCRIMWGRVLAAADSEVVVRCRHLSWDGNRLALSAPAPRRVAVWHNGYSAMPDVAVGDIVALHWDQLCGRLRPQQVRHLAATTIRQLRVTNERLSRR